VLGDIQNVLARRYPVAKLLFCPALVQGEGAPLALANALRTLDGRCDVIIIGRGGGSEEDLWAFQSEVLAAAIVQAQTPVISAVGHQGDVTICDMVADRRAPTPSAAAELATPSARQLTETLKEAEYRLRTGAARLLDAQRARLAALAKSPALASPRHGLYIRREKLHFYSKTLYNKKRIYIQARRLSLAGRAAVLDGVSPLKVLSRGYALVSRAGRSLADAGALRVGDRVHIRLHRGAADAQITETMPEEAQYAEKETGTDI
jgi:exodeoxyribonuclease VII, large subunit